MNVVSDMGPPHYLVLIEAEYVLPLLFERVFVPRAVHVEMSHPNTPEPVRRWAAAPPPWVKMKQPRHVEDIPALGWKDARGAGEKAAIALAREERVPIILMDDLVGRREARSRGLDPLWTLQILDEAAERGILDDLAGKLDRLERQTPFYIGERARVAIEGMLQRESQWRRDEPKGRPPGKRPPGTGPTP